MARGSIQMLNSLCAGLILLKLALVVPQVTFADKSISCTGCVTTKIDGREQTVCKPIKCSSLPFNVTTPVRVLPPAKPRIHRANLFQLTAEPIDVASTSEL
jgi:hypothetical protein